MYVSPHRVYNSMEFDDLRICQMLDCRLTSGVANYGASKKDDNMSSSIIMQTASLFAVDTAGDLSDSARKFINELYAKPRSDEQSFWTCDKDRITLKVRFVDSLSCILARNRAMDIIRMRTKFILRKMDIELYKYLVNLRILMIKVWGERIIFLIRFPLPPLWNLNSAYLSSN